MGNTKSVSKSSVVSLTKSPICANRDCKYRVALGKIYCTLHDENPMRPGRLKKEVTEPEKDRWSLYSCCRCVFALS
jgi:hypothetical protein